MVNRFTITQKTARSFPLNLRYMASSLTATRVQWYHYLGKFEIGQ